MAEDGVSFHVKPLGRAWRRWAAWLAAGLLAFTAGVAGGYDYDATRAPVLAGVLAVAWATAVAATGYGVLTWVIGRTPPVAVLDKHGVAVRARHPWQRAHGGTGHASGQRRRAEHAGSHSQAGDLAGTSVVGDVERFDLIVPWAQVTRARLERPRALSTYLCLDVNDPSALLQGFDAVHHRPDSSSSGLGVSRTSSVASEQALRRLRAYTAEFGTPLAVNLRRYWRHRSLDELDAALQRLTYGRLTLER